MLCPLRACVYLLGLLPRVPSHGGCSSSPPPRGMVLECLLRRIGPASEPRGRRLGRKLRAPFRDLTRREHHLPWAHSRIRNSSPEVKPFRSRRRVDLGPGSVCWPGARSPFVPDARRRGTAAMRVAPRHGRGGSGGPNGSTAPPTEAGSSDGYSPSATGRRRRKPVDRAAPLPPGSSARVIPQGRFRGIRAIVRDATRSSCPTVDPPCSTSARVRAGRPFDA